MNFNKLVLDKIDNLVNLTKKFDMGFKIIINLPNENIDEKNINEIYTLTKHYIEIRSEHGYLLIMMNQLLNSATKSLSDSDPNKIIGESTDYLYDLSTFNSLIINVGELVNNIDFQYKKIALKYPKFINKKPFTVILFTNSDTDSKVNSYIEMIEQLRKEFPENYYKIIKCEKNNRKIKCELNLPSSIKIKTLPSLLIQNGDSSITEIPLDKINGIESIISILK